MKLRLSLVIMFLSALLLPGGGLSLELGVTYNNFNGDIKDIYSATNMSYGIEMSYKISKNMELFSHIDFLSAKGKLSYTKEDTTLKITPIELGGRFVLGNKFAPYFGLGVGKYSYRETNRIGVAIGSGFGFFGEGGVFMNFNKIFFDTKIKYISIKVDNVDLSVLKGTIGFGVRF